MTSHPCTEIGLLEHANLYQPLLCSGETKRKKKRHRTSVKRREPLLYFRLTVLLTRGLLFLYLDRQKSLGRFVLFSPYGVTDYWFPQLSKMSG